MARFEIPDGWMVLSCAMGMTLARLGALEGFTESRACQRRGVARETLRMIVEERRRQYDLARAE